MSVGKVKPVILPLAIIIVFILIGFFSDKLLFSKQQTPSINLPTVVPQASANPNEIILKEADPSDTSMKETVILGCGDNLPNYKFSLSVPGNWTLKRGKTSADISESDYQATGDGGEVVFGCTSLPVTDGTCDSSNMVNITVGDFTKKGCLGQTDGIANMGIFTLPKDGKTGTVIFFAANSVPVGTLNKILSSFRNLNI